MKVKIALNVQQTGPGRQMIRLIDWLIDLLVDYLIDWLIDRLIDWSIYLLIDRVIDWLIDWLNFYAVTVIKRCHCIIFIALLFVNIVMGRIIPNELCFYRLYSEQYLRATRRLQRGVAPLVGGETSFFVFPVVIMMFEITSGCCENVKECHVQSSRGIVPDKGLLSRPSKMTRPKILKWHFSIPHKKRSIKCPGSVAVTYVRHGRNLT